MFSIQQGVPLPGGDTSLYTENFKKGRVFYGTISINAFQGKSKFIVCIKSIDLQYLATLVWNKDEPHYVPHGKDKEIDHMLLQKFFDVNEIFELNDNTENGAKEEQQRGCTDSNEFPELYVSAVGDIFRLLDDNFGILRVGDNLVLFDICDFWIDSNTTLYTHTHTDIRKLLIK